MKERVIETICMLQLIKYDFNIKIKDLEDKVKKSDFLITDGTLRIDMCIFVTSNKLKKVR